MQQVSTQETASRLNAIEPTEVHDQFSARLHELVRGRMSQTLRRRLDPEDIVQSAFRIFFRAHFDSVREEGSSTDRVWGLLYAITLNKLRFRTRYHAAGKRAVHRDTTASDVGSQISSHELEVELQDELQWIMDRSTIAHRKILASILSGCDEREASDIHECSMRTVYRVVERATAHLQCKLR